MRNLIFDLDGTIINSSKEVLYCFEKAFKKSGYEIDKSRLTPNVIGPPLKEIIKNIAVGLEDEDMIEKITKNFRSIYDYDTNDISEFYDGIYDLLTEEKNNGKKLFLATYKPTKPTERIIKQFKLDMFDEIYTIDKFGNHITKSEMIDRILLKNDLNKDETIMIGDAISDIDSAHQSGVRAVGVLWGYGENKKPLIEKADAIVKSCSELKQICQNDKCCI